ncbi:MAG TPA: sugar transferase [Candidatus Eremiobacteraceae bacterium]|jgi:lipopolysaccharide/colanic/teichoic acid biosynthesis glycosyltransferase
MSAPSAIIAELSRQTALTPPRIFELPQIRRRVPVAWTVLKRVSDVFISAILLVVLAPVLAVIALAVKMTSPGSVLFSQLRVGKDGKTFRFYKFRTMVDGAHLLHECVAHLNECDGPALKIANDPRLHGLGPFLRRTSLDELPQLWNVLRGEMSLVGPRPALPNEVANYATPYYERFDVMPGLTGLWQVSGRATVPFKRWMAMDIWYVRNWTPLVDLWLLLRTIPAVLFREGAW